MCLCLGPENFLSECAFSMLLWRPTTVPFLTARPAGSGGANDGSGSTENQEKLLPVFGTVQSAVSALQLMPATQHRHGPAFHRPSLSKCSGLNTAGRNLVGGCYMNWRQMMAKLFVRKTLPFLFNVSTHLRLPGKNQSGCRLSTSATHKDDQNERRWLRRSPLLNSGDKRSIVSVMRKQSGPPENCQSTSLQKAWEISQHDLLVEAKMEPLQKAIVAPEPA